MSSLATRFGKKITQLRRDRPLSADEIRAAAPSIFAEEKHESRSERYTYIPTSDLLQGLQKEGFEPFMVAQSRTRIAERSEHTKHMVRLRHATQINADEANEIILVNSHDGTSSYQMLAGVYRFVCANGMIRGDELADIRVPHKGDVQGRVIEGAYRVLDQFDATRESIAGMKTCRLPSGAQEVFAAAALELRYEDAQHRPITTDKLLSARRLEDRGDDLWSTFNVVQENMLQGGLIGRTAQGNRTSTRAITGIDQNVKLNRALWVLAEGMRKLAA